MKKNIILLLFILISINLYSIEEIGIASWYGPNFHGKKTANGEIFNTNDFTAAHRTLPFGSIVKVISLENNKSIIVRINDRGPFAKNRIIDLSKAAAQELNMIDKGTMKVKTILLETGDNKYHKFNNQKYAIQIASFKNKEKALVFIDKYKEKEFKLTLKKVKIDTYYYRILINNLNYYELQIYRIKLHKEGIRNYLILKI